MRQMFTNDKQLFGRLAVYKILSLLCFLIIYQFSFAKTENLSPAPPLISGLVWEDVDGNGQQDGGEPSLAGIDVDLMDNTGTNVLDNTTTDASGIYSFEDLTPDTYVIRFNLSGSWTYTEQFIGAAGTDSDASQLDGKTDPLVLGAGASITNIDAGYYVLATIGNEVWEDMDGNGINDDGATGINGVTVTIDGFTGAGTSYTDTDVTNAGGFYQFDDVPPGDYTLNFSAGGTWQGTAQDQGGDDTVDSDADPTTGDTGNITLLSQDNNQDWDAGFWLHATVSDYVWEDMNANGVQDGNGAGIDGVTVTIDGTTGDGNLYNDSDVTAGGGFYVFDDVPPGNYTLNFGTPGGYEPTVKDNGPDNVDSDADETTGDTDPFDLESNEVNEDMDAGFFQFARIGDFVWEDLNGDGIQDGGEPGIGGAAVDIDGTTGAGVVYNNSTTTDGAGFYEFIDLVPGNYTLTFYVPAGYGAFSLADQTTDDLDSDPDPGTGQTIPIDLVSAQDFEDFDAGIYEYVSIGDFCWEDMNGDGVQDGGEPGIDGIKVTATRSSDGASFFATTGGGGNYLIQELKPDEYTVNFLTPAGFEITAPDMTSDDLDSDPDPGTANTTAFDLFSGDETLDIDAGFYQFITIGDRCWRDSNTDGIQDAGESGFANVDINLTGTTGAGEAVNLSTTSDGFGDYEFGDLAPGSYQIEFITPPSFAPSPFQNGGNSDIDSDAPISNIVDLQSGVDEPSIDAGYFVEPPEDCDQDPANVCQDAEVLCDIEDIHDFCTVMLDPWNPNVPAPLCPSGGFAHNPSWFAFVASAETVTLIIHASDCSVGGGQQIGIQYGIYEDCGPPWDPLICQPNCELPGDITVTSNQFVPGEDYFFFIDGCNGTICTYWIEIVEGGGFYEVNDPTGISCDEDDGDCENVCLGADVEFTLDDCDNAVDYIWTIDGVIDENLTEQTVVIEFLDEGTYTLCGYGENVCDQSEEVCITVTVSAEPDEDLGAFEVCADVLENTGIEPADWEGGVINTPGNFTTEVENEFGCLFTQLVEIIELPNEEAVVDTLACFGDVVDFLGEEYTFDVDDVPLVDVGGSANGCDKYVTFSATFLNVPISAFNDLVCLGDGVFELSIFELVTEPVEAGVSIQWYHGTDPVDGPKNVWPYTVQVTEEGIYRAVATVEYQGHYCEFELDGVIEIYYDELYPEEPEQNDWTLQYCNNVHDTLAYSIFDPNFQYTYEWTYPGDLSYVFYDVDEGILYIDWFNSTGGFICVKAVNECGESTEYCEEIIINPGPTSGFTAPDTICLTDLANIEYTGGASGAATYTWGFSNGVDTSGNNDQGAGPYVLSWDTEGEKNITLEVIENGCVSPVAQHTVVVQPPLDVPFVECQPNQSEILFLWDSIPNASGYQVEVIAGASGVLNGTNYFVDGLMPEDSVSLIITALSDSYCPPAATDTITCYAVDCPDINLEFLVQDTSICYTGGGDPFILPHIIDPDDFGTITWSGTGIIDTETGLFHPDSAGFGSHNIVLSHQFDVCVKNVQATINLYETPTADFEISSDSICNTDLLTINYTGNAPGGNATWDFDSPDNLTGQDLGQHSAGWDTEGWKTITLQVERSGCLSGVETRTVYVEEALPEIDIDCESSVDSVVFTWPDNAQIEAYEISINGNLENTLNANTWTVSNLNEGDVVTISLVGINSGICANTTGELECEAEACPIFTVDFTPVVDSICLVEGINPIQFDANLGGVTEPGDIIWGGNGVDPVTGLFDPVAAGVGTHTISYTYAEGSCDIDTSFIVTIVDQPVTDFSIDESVICITDVITVTNNAYNPSFEYHWDFGSANVNQLSDEMYELSWDQDGTYDVSLYVNNALCEADLVSYSVEVEPELVLPAISTDSTSQSITLNWHNVDCASAYQIIVDGNLLTETTDLSYTIMGLAPSQTVSIEFVVISECSCPGISVTFNSTTMDCEDIELSIDELPFAICEDELTPNMTLHATVIGTQNGNILWSGNSITTNGNEGFIDLSAISAGEYNYTLSYDLDNCHYEYSDILTIHPAVSMDATATDPSCNGTTDGSIQILPGGGTAPFTYLMNGVQSDTTNIGDLSAGSYTLEVSDLNGCKDDFQVTLNNPPLIIPEIVGIDLLQENVSANYSINFASTPTNASYTWYFTGGDTICSGPECASIDITITEDVELCVNVAYNGNQCEEFDCFEIRFEETVDVYIPNVFSPNNDDQNDYFFIESDDSVILIKSMNIFDRWGEMVFQRTNFAPNEQDLGWDGTFNGKTLNPSVFVYDIVIVTEEQKELRYTGDITLIR